MSGMAMDDFKMRDERAFLPNYTQVTPKNDHIVVRPIVERLSSVIDVQTEHRDRIVKGEVIACGPKVKSRIAAGDVIYFSQIQRFQVSPELWIIRDNNLAFAQEAP
jgi:hypothetical protein